MGCLRCVSGWVLAKTNKLASYANSKGQPYYWLTFEFEPHEALALCSVVTAKKWRRSKMDHAANKKPTEKS
jgi:hypothetical protein